MAYDQALRARLAEAGLRRASKFSWSRCAAQILEVRKEVS